MPGRRTEEWIARLRDLAEPTPDLLKGALGSKRGPVIATAARRIRSEGWAAWLVPLAATFDDLVDDGVKRDPGCGGKLATVEALAEAGETAWAVYRKGATLVQREPVWGGTEDTAVGLRAACVLALVHTRDPEGMPLVVDALADEAGRVRAAAAMALGDGGGPGAAWLLRYKLRVGDDDPEVIGAVLGALLFVEPDQGRALADKLLRDGAPRVRESVGLALGETRRPDALPLLEAWLERATDRDERATALVALALLRAEDAWRVVADVIVDGGESDAHAGVRALAPFAGDPTLAVLLRPAHRADVRRRLVEVGLVDP